MPEGSLRVAVLGGGVAGLATGLAIRRAAAARGLRVALSIFEREPVPGGKLLSLREDGFVVEWGPNGFLNNEPATLALVESLGLGDRLLRSEDASRHRFLLVGGRLRELPLSPPAFLASDLLPFGAKLRMGAEFFIPARRDLGRAAEGLAHDETIDEFGRRRLGAGFAETLLDPMVKGIFGGDARRLSLAACFPRMVELEREHGGLLKAMIRIGRERRRNGVARPEGGAGGPGGTLHSFDAGMAVLPEALARELGDDLVLGAAVEGVRKDRGGWRVRAGGEDRGVFAAVVDATPAHAAVRHHDDAALRAVLAAIPYAPMAVVTLAYRRSDVAHALDGFGMLIPRREGRRLLGVLWSSSIFRGRSPDGTVLLRCMAGGAADPATAALSDDELLRLAVEELTDLYGLRGKPARRWIIRHERAIAQYERGHPARLAALDLLCAERPGLHFTGSAYRGVSVNHCVAEAARCADAVCAELAAATEEEVRVAAPLR